MRISSTSVLAGIVLACSLQTLCSAQSVDPYAEARQKESTLQDYRAAQQKRNVTPDADAALTSDVVIEILQSQPALKLQVKRVLIQKAMDQGRLLAEEDLGDVDLFQLIRDDSTL